jgi:hypothetical protein
MLVEKRSIRALPEVITVPLRGNYRVDMPCHHSANW